MKEDLSNLMIGIISGVVSAMLIWFFVLIYNKLIKPTIKELLYKGIDLEGEWHANLFIEKEINENGLKKKIKEKIKEITISINQTAYQLKGDLIIKNIFGKNDEQFSFYKFDGFIRDNYVILNYLPKSKKCIGLGSITLIVKEGGKSLKGSLNGTSLNEMTLIYIDDINLKRK